MNNEQILLLNGLSLILHNEFALAFANNKVIGIALAVKRRESKLPAELTTTSKPKVCTQYKTYHFILKWYLS